MSIDLVAVKLLNGKEFRCDGNKIGIVIRGKSQDDSSVVCYSKKKQQIVHDTTAVWEGYGKEMLGTGCKQILFDPDKEMKVQVRTDEASNGLCPIKVQLEILDIASNTPRYFCKEMPKKDFFKGNNKERFIVKEERCF